MIGILGGMGPLATADLFKKIIYATGAATDQEHLPVIICSDPRIPDRQSAFFEDRHEISPLPAMLRGIRSLEAAGAQCIVVACNTAHHWFDVLQAETALPLLHIADAACLEIKNLTHQPRKVALLGTLATVESGFYQARLLSLGLPFVVLSPAESEKTFDRAIALVKKGDVDAAAPIAVEAIEKVVSKGADLAILACTELPVALANIDSPIQLLDATDALAKRVVQWGRERFVCLPTWAKGFSNAN
ncbi:aspartate/glutamate racemase family protein [Rhizobium rhizogenes]|uniref:aspartate/glutamate racemase family protein n=1 Tax=Rhizobium rhizogenes TaxID=359 RepID=UPI001573C0F3|nr:amino acid racemase [Rhizobium rhizogenes]NTG64812.1 amino acid racemase [Rhizobium rhizogenes]NTH68519.1 amino acid racemase [Rhizobium rhizogenes]NTI00015.1 amino acid racemase [Rhizobium rhizogenes]NTI39147.1 amino acid racemase [Rhizobium rhizogenes]NTJ18306.1 amino acid racemase [Rhizobium rhizogenes]